jgi:hypothetical protein
VYPTVRAALTLGGPAFACDAVLLIRKHGMTQSMRPVSTSGVGRRSPGRSVLPQVNPPSSYRSGSDTHPSSVLLRT